jgi:AraC-like DNA-binding protein
MQEYACEYADIWYALPHEGQDAGGCRIVRAGQNLAKPNYCIGPKIIGHYGFHWVLEGRVQVKEGTQLVVLGKGDMFCLLPERSYIYEIASDEHDPPLQMIWLTLDGIQMPWIVSQLRLNCEAFWSQGVVDPHILITLRRILQLFRKGELDPLLEKSLIYDLLWRMKNKIDSRICPVKLNWVDRVKEYLELHYTENIRIEDAAHLVGMHRSHLYVAFQREYGCSPMQYLQKVRMDKAAQMLKETLLSITEIALSLGYPELYSFSRSFAKYYGSPPKTYRHAMKQV